MKSNILRSNEARLKLLDGVNTIADSVKVTLGAAGRTVVIDHENFPYPHITKDGVTVANSIFIEDPIAHTGVRLIKSVAKTAVDSTGDGTTTATVIAQSLIQRGIDVITKGVNSVRLAKGINQAKDLVVDHVKKNTINIEYGSKELENIATISANNDRKIGEVVAEAVNTAGEHGTVTVEQSETVYTTIEHVEGIVVDSGYLSPYFINNQSKGTAEYKEAFIFVTNRKIQNINDIQKLMALAMTNQKSLVIIASEFIGEALSTLIVNSVQKQLPITAIEAPSFGDLSKDYLNDIAVLTGGKFVSMESGITLDEVTSDMFGYAEKVVINSMETNIIGAAGDPLAIKSLISELEDNLKQSTVLVDTQFIKERLAKITGGVVIVKVGANTKMELKERTDRFDDAIGAAKAAVKQGIVIGGGLALRNASIAVEKKVDKIKDEDEKLGARILLRAIQAPSSQIIMNSGLDKNQAEDILLGVKKGQVFDVLTDKFVNAISSGIIDPSKVVISSLESAVSIGSIALTTECAIVNVSEPRPQ